jgi:RimJ/RimL family protein N-acetyltransferase
VTIRLEQFTEEHLPLFDEILDDPAVLRFTRMPSEAPPDFPARWLERYREGRRERTLEAFAIVSGEGRAIGFAGAVAIDVETATAELGYVVAPAARGRGVGSQALALLTDWAFADLGAERLELMISVENEPSKRVAGRCGYRLEGVLRSIFVKPGLRDDMELWSLLRGDARPEATARG